MITCTCANCEAPLPNVPSMLAASGLFYCTVCMDTAKTSPAKLKLTNKVQVKVAGSASPLCPMSGEPMPAGSGLFYGQCPTCHRSFLRAPRLPKHYSPQRAMLTEGRTDGGL